MRSFENRVPVEGFTPTGTSPGHPGGVLLDLQGQDDLPAAASAATASATATACILHRLIIARIEVFDVSR
jgi:hypothetical protein